MSVLQYSLLFGAALVGGVIALLVRKVNRQVINLVLSFSGAYLFSITVIHLIPEVFHVEVGEHEHTSMQSMHELGLWVLLGFFIQLILEQLSKGAEHGHIHPPEHPSPAFLISLLLGLSIHAFLEGLPLAEKFQFGEARAPLLYGIALHKLPAAFALVSIIIASKKSTTLAILFLVFFASMSPLSAFLADHVMNTAILDYLNPIIAVVIGSFLHISTTILFESSTKLHQFSWYKILAIVAGTGIALLSIW